ncbi:NDR1/HIN1-like protein 13 [Neltuma alba]|uniref:NDR1/HIN1-like protein 13 n=1 Tax=Neltuma alba TaxID=207710 RepID=UPI0010A3E640|nr:NDR1/HIN1-like protein 13 [Prosopis alba]
MADRVYPSAKPATAVYGRARPSFPATKAQLYGATRPAYRPQPYLYHRQSHRRRCCTFCFWFLLVILILLFLTGVAGIVLYLLYRPHSPSFTVDSFKLSYLNMTSSSSLNSRFELNITATNPNKKIAFQFERISISVISGDVSVGDGRMPSFEHGKKNTTLLRALITSNGAVLDGESASRLKADLQRENGLDMKVNLYTKVKAKMGRLKTPKVGLRVSCEGIRVTVPAAAKKQAMAATSGAKCKVHVRFKIWKWCIG